MEAEQPAAAAAEEYRPVVEAEARRVADDLKTTAVTALQRKLAELGTDLRIRAEQSFADAVGRVPFVGKREPEPVRNPEGPLRVAVLLPGIRTESGVEFKGRDSQTFGHIYFLFQRALRGYDDVVFFSYNCGSARPGPDHPQWIPAPYVYTDIFASLQTSVAQLECLLTAYQQATERPVEFDLIGHSLGGRWPSSTSPTEEPGWHASLR